MFEVPAPAPSHPSTKKLLYQSMGVDAGILLIFLVDGWYAFSGLWLLRCVVAGACIYRIRYNTLTHDTLRHAIKFSLVTAIMFALYELIEGEVAMFLALDWAYFHFQISIVETFLVQ